MNWLTFIADMTKALAWPIAAIVIVYVFRKQVAGLIGRVTNLTTPLGSINADAREARTEAENLPDNEFPKDLAHEAARSEDGHPLDAPAGDDFSLALSRALRLADIAPKEAIELAWDVFLRSSKALVNSTRDETVWSERPSPLVSLAQWGLPAHGLEVVKSLEEVYNKSRTVRFVREPTSPEAAHDFCAATYRVLTLVLSIARHPSRAAESTG